MNYDVSEDVKYWAEDENGAIRFYDEQQRMHNKTGPALIRNDGKCGYYYHGIWKKGEQDGN